MPGLMLLTLAMIDSYPVYYGWTQPGVRAPVGVVSFLASLSYALNR